MNIDSILNDLFSRRNRGIKPGLERITEALTYLENPQDNFKVIHIAGTNGKGSTVAMVSSILKESGHKVGSFTSPHIVDFRERFKINEKIVDDKEWLSAWEECQEICDRFELTFFEISTIIALLIFRNNSCEYVVLETGLGGRLDSTNVCTPSLTIITALSVEHTEYLGNTLEEIATEKLGIVKERIPLIINGNNKEEVIELAKKVTKGKNSELIVSEIYPSFVDDSGNTIITFDGLNIKLPIKGDFQVDNASVVIDAMGKLNFSKSIIKRGLEKTFIPCRNQLIKYEGKEIIFDVAHNPQAIQSLLHGVTTRPNLLIGVMKDKEVDTIVPLFKNKVDKIFVISPKIPRAMSSKELKQHFINSGFSDVTINSTNSETIDYAIKNSDKLLITGSFYTVSDVLQELNISPFTF